MKLLLALTPACLIFAGCGYIGDTRPPTLNLPVPVKDLAAVERGDKIIVQFTTPTISTDNLPLKEAPHMQLDVAGDKYDVTPGKPTTMFDVPAKPYHGKQVRIAVKALNDREKDAGLSNLVELSVIPAVPAPESVTPVADAKGVKLTWQSPAPNFRVFRQGPDEKALGQIGSSESPAYLDETAQYGKSYRYAVQAIVGTTESEIAETDPFVPKDEFAPAVPAGLAAVVGIQSVQLVWERDTDPDLAGYRIYRDAGTGQFERIGESKNTPGFSDRSIEHGKRYRYAVTAFDQLGNESKLSEVAEVAVP